MAKRTAVEALYIELQTLLTSAAGVPCYAIEPPRRDDGAINTAPPFVVYTADPTAPADEGGEWSLTLMLDVWSVEGFKECLNVAGALDRALDGTTYGFECGTLCADRNGLCLQRMEHDPYDPRIRRVRSQYLLRFNENQSY